MSEKIVELSIILVVDTDKSDPVYTWPWQKMFALEGVRLYDVAYRLINPDVLEYEGVH